MNDESLPAASPRRLLAFAVLACGITWACAYPAVQAFSDGITPTAGQTSLAGLSAFGPLLAAVAVTWGTGGTRGVFGPWRVHPGWLVAALLMPMAVNVVARGLDAATGGSVDAWVYLPSTAVHVAGLVVFPLGEEFGWRGYAQPRLVARYGPVAGPILLGTLWAVWHAMYLISPETGQVEPVAMILFAMLPAWSVVYVWAMRRAGGSIAVALALHAGAHLDKVDRLPLDDVSARVWIVVVACVAAAFAGKPKRQRQRYGSAQ